MYYMVPANDKVFQSPMRITFMSTFLDLLPCTIRGYWELSASNRLERDADQKISKIDIYCTTLSSGWYFMTKNDVFNKITFFIL